MNQKLKNAIKHSVLFRIIVKTSVYKNYTYKKFYTVRKKILMDEAILEFTKNSPVNGSLEDYKIAFKKHLCSYSEYMYQYELQKLSETQRNEYVSRL